MSDITPIEPADTDIMYEGKSKIIYKGPDDNSYIMRYKNTATAFDGEKKQDFAGKGQLNAAISNLIYAYLTENGIRTHLLETYDDITVLVRRVEVVPVEVIIRNTAAGSFSRRFGVEEGAHLANTVVEFSLKSDELSDPMINESQITALSLATIAELNEMTQMSLKINDLLRELFRKANILLVDFKLEFGRSTEGIILCDEITPDSCRLWDIDTMRKLDKDVFRRDLGDLLDGYRVVLAKLQEICG